MSIQQAVKRLVALVREEAARNNFSKVTSIHIRLGSQETLNADELARAFEENKKDNLIKDAKLVVKKRKTLARCRYCGNIFEVFYIKNRCRKCGSTYMEFISDRGISLEKIEGYKNMY